MNLESLQEDVRMFRKAKAKKRAKKEVKKKHVHYPDLPEIEPCPKCRRRGHIRKHTRREGDLIVEQVKAIACKDHGDFIVIHGMPSIVTRSNYAESYWR